MVAAAVRTIFAQPDSQHVREQLDVIAGIAFTTVPRPHWRKIWSTNPLERVKKERSNAAATS